MQRNPKQRQLLVVASICFGALCSSNTVRAVTLTIGSQAGCTNVTLQSAFDTIRTLSGSHELRIMKGNYAVPDGMIYDPVSGISQSAVFVVGGFTNCADPAPSGDPTADADRAVFNGAGGLARSVLDLEIHGRVGTFQMRRIVLRGGDAGNGSNELYNIGGGMAVHGRASVLLGLGTSIKNNAAGRGGGVALVGSPIGSGSVASAFKADLYITEGADITQNSAAAEGGGIYCGGADLSGGANVKRHGTIILVDGTINGNSADCSTAAPVHSLGAHRGAARSTLLFPPTRMDARRWVRVSARTDCW
jgi:predicted outer membrane repeat protein